MLKIALAGNPNSGKTTLFNALTGSNQFVGNWPGVTVEKKEGKLKKHDGVVVTDLPGIYSLSPYTLEEVVARKYLINERPDAILNIIDATNLERNLYLTTQLTELGIPVVIALNMMDVVRKTGDKINTEELSRQLGCKIVEISALKGDGIEAAAAAAVNAAKSGKTVPQHAFSGEVEHAIAHIEEAAVHGFDEEKQRWYAIKIFERDEKVLAQLNIPAEKLAHIEKDIKHVEDEFDDDAESIITNERYIYIAQVLKSCYKKKDKNKLTVSDKIDKVVTHRIWALPIFAVIMFLVYFISVTTVGTWVTDWTNDGLFGEGFHFLGIDGGYGEISEEYAEAETVINGYIEATNNEALAELLDTESESFNVEAAKAALFAFSAIAPNEATYTVINEEDLTEEEVTSTKEDLLNAIAVYEKYDCTAPDPADYGAWVLGVPVLATMGLEAINCAPWLQGLIVDGIIGGVGAVLGFVPQILVLFIFLALLESCGYMARIAFVLDRIFRHFGLSGKSFIPMLIGTGCGIPGVMASRTIENESDRRMTIMTTTFIPCGAKLPFIGLVAGAVFGNAWWVAPVAYFIGMAAIIVSGVILKKTKAFAGEPAPFVMELPAYRLPTFGNTMRSMWERGWSFIKKAGTIILLSTVVVWFLTYFGFTSDGFRMLSDEELDMSMLSYIGRVFAWIFAPIGFGNWQAAVASLTGLVAKENIVGTLKIVIGDIKAIGDFFTTSAGFSFLVFNLLCAPCFAAMGAIKREMNNGKWTAFAITYQCVFAYLVSFICYHFGNLFTGVIWNGTMNMAWGIIGLILAVALVALFVFAIIRPDKKKAKTIKLK